MLKTITLVIKDSKDVLLAADVLPVIRCRACGRGQEADDGTGIVYCCWYSREVPGNNYCGQGKPKEEK